MAEHQLGERGRNEGRGLRRGYPGRGHMVEGSEQKGALSVQGKKEGSLGLELGWGCGVG